MSKVNPEDVQQQDQQQHDSGELFSQTRPAAGDPWVLGEDDDSFDGDTLPAASGIQPPPATGQTPTPSVPAQDGGVREIRLPTGQVLRGTPDEIIRQQQDIITRSTQATPLEYHTADDRQSRGWRDPEPAPNRGIAGWDNTKRTQFFEIMAKEPEKAMEMFMKDYFGNDNPAEALDRSYSVAVQVSDRISVADFLASNPDFPASPESAAIVIKRLDRDNAGLTPWNLEVAYRQLVREGVLAPIQQAAATTQQQQTYQSQYEAGSGQQQQQQVVPPQQQQRSRGAGAPPPAPNGGTPIDRSTLRLNRDEFESLSAVEMKAYMATHAIPDRFFPAARR